MLLHSCYWFIFDYYIDCKYYFPSTYHMQHFVMLKIADKLSFVVEKGIKLIFGIFQVYLTQTCAIFNLAEQSILFPLQ